MILTSLAVDPGELARATGWHLETDGLCRDGVCVPFRPDDRRSLDPRAVARALGMPLVEDAATGLAALGPRSGGRALTSAAAPELELPDLDGRPFRLSSLRGQKVLILAWAPW
jgi:hypothetical protein